MSHWESYKQDWLLLTEAGFIAVNQMDEDTAFKLFKAAETLHPEKTLCKVGYGYLYLHKLDLKNACKAFEEVLQMEPKNEMAKAMLGVALSLGPATLERGEKILEETHHAKDSFVKNLSDSATSFVGRFLKKNPGPAGGHKKT